MLSIPLDQLWEKAWGVGIPFVLVLMALAGFYWDLIFTKTRVDKMEKDFQARLLKEEKNSEKWEKLALSLGGMTDRALSVAEQHTRGNLP